MQRISTCYAFFVLLFFAHLKTYSFLGKADAISRQHAKQLKKMDYYATLASIAWQTSEGDSYKKVPSAIADFAVTDLACKSLCKYTGIKNKKWVLPFLPFVLLGGKQLIVYAIAACKSGYACKNDLQKRYGNKWPLYFVTGIFIPYALRNQVTSKLFDKVDEKTGLTQIVYPEFVLKSNLLTVLAWQMHGTVVDWCGNMIQSAYDLFVPETRAEKYIRIKNVLASMAAEG